MDEYIKREAVQDRMESVDWYHVNDSGELIHGATSDMDSYLPTKEVYRVIDEVPAAEVAPVVHGRWEWKNGKPFCSVCKEQAEPRHHFEDGTVEEYDYCPNCGARMDGE